MVLGYALVLTASMLFGLIYAIDQGILKKYSPGTILVLSSIVTFTVNFILSNKKEIVEIAEDYKSLALVAFGAFLGTIATRLTLHSIQMIGAARSSIVEITYPVFVCLFCYVLYRETLDYKFAIGASLIIIGTIVVMQSSIK